MDEIQRQSEPGAAPEPAAPQARAAAAADATTVSAVVRELSALLGAAGVDEAGREARDIVAAVVDMPRFWPSMNGGESLGEADLARARAAAARRAAGAPFAYAVGRAAFRHLTLDVDERVLIPRQETEALVDAVLECAGDGGVAVDVGTGSGAIALALAMEGSFDLVIGTDVSVGALAVARANAARSASAMKAPLEFRAGSLLAPVRDVRARVLVSNPPYIAHDEAAALPGSVRDWEPVFALFTGAGGMAATAEIIRGAPAVLESGGLLAIEVDSRRAALAAEIALADGRYNDVTVRFDLTGRENSASEASVTNQLEDKAKELGRIIGQSAEYQAVKRANDALNSDRDAVTVLHQMEELRQNAQRMITRGEQPTQEMEQELDELLGRVQGNPLYQGVAVAQENFDKVMVGVNEWILEGIRKGSASPIITLG